MDYSRPNTFKDFAGVLAAIVFAVACLVAAFFHLKILIDLNQRGIRVHAIVVGMERGARNSKWAVYHYTTNSGREVTTRDTFQQYIRGVNRGESVIVIYDRDDIKKVTADLGIWTWQAPAIFLSGFVLLAILAILIWRHRST